MSTVLSSMFIQTFGGLSNAEMIRREFDKWKSSGKTNLYFGKDGRNLNSKYLFHVHFIPSTPDEITIWKDNFTNNRKRTSDEIIFYASNGSKHLLLIFKQNGHSSMNDAKLMTALNSMAEDFVTFGTIP